MFSFGMMLWEMVNRARIYTAWWPDETMAPTKKGKDGKESINVPLIAARLAEGERPDVPADCPAALGLLMQSCWEHDIDKRPKAPMLLRVIKLIRSEGLLDAAPDQAEPEPETDTSYDDWLASLNIQDKKQELHDYDIREGQDPLGTLVEMLVQESAQGVEEYEDFTDMVEGDLFEDDPDAQKEFRAAVGLLLEQDQQSPADGSATASWPALLQLVGLEAEASAPIDEQRGSSSSARSNTELARELDECKATIAKLEARLTAVEK
jgi:hypothetical protein